jgi:site-specific recombinase XerC
MPTALLDPAGRRRSPATTPGYLSGRAPRNKGRRYPADPPRVEEIVAVMRTAGAGPGAKRVRALIVVLWRAGLRVGEALALAESDLDSARGSILVRHGKGDKRREAGMDDWAWSQMAPWLGVRKTYPVGPLFCIVRGPTAGGPWSSTAVRSEFRRLGQLAGVRRRFAPHQLRHAHAVEMAREGVPLNIIQRQLGHANLGITSIYLQGIDNGEIIDAVHGRAAPVISASAGLRL